MYYTYILFSNKSNNFYYGFTEDVKKRLQEHNSGLVFSTKPYCPWQLVFFASFETKELATNFESYLKTGSGKAFAYKRLLNTKQYKISKQ